MPSEVDSGQKEVRSGPVVNKEAVAALEPPEAEMVHKPKPEPEPQSENAVSLSQTAQQQLQNEPYSVFSGLDRYAIASMASLASLYSPLTANVYFPAIPIMTQAFHESTEAINVTVTVYMVVQGISPTLLGSISDRKGRRPLFIACFLILILSTTGLALTPTNAYWLLVVLRCVQAGGSASTVALSAGVIADIIPTEDRGGYMGLVNLGAMLGPCLGPVIGGVLVDKLGWRSIFWFIVIAAGSFLFCIVLFMPETLRSMVGNGSIPAPRWNRALISAIGRRTLSASSIRPPPRPVPNPFLLFTRPDLVLILLSMGFVYAAFYAVTATLSSLFSQHYSFLSETEIGLCFLAAGGGGALGTVFQGKVLDWQFRSVKKKFEEEKAARRAAGDIEEQKADPGHDGHDDDFPIEEATLRTQFIYIFIFSAASIGYGWSIDKGASIAVPLVLQVIMAYAAVAIMINIQVLIVDLFPGQGAAVTAANNLVRCLLGAIGVSLINVITDRIKPGWTYTLGGALCMLTMPMVLTVLKMGPRWRRQRREKATGK